jgi:thiol-disulfide isomerase/thioredoxin
MKPSLLAWSCCLFLTIVSVAVAQNAPPKPAKVDPPATLELGDSLDDLTSALFTMPMGDDTQALARFVRRIIEFRPQSRDEANLFRKKAPLALKKATTKILSLEKDTASKPYRLAKLIDLQFKAVDAVGEDADDGDRKALLADMLKFITAGDKSADDLALAEGYAVDLEYLPARELAAEAYAKFGQLFADSPNEEFAQEGKKMLGAARRLNIVGQPAVLKGTTLDDKEIDLASLRGKVVLIDFWATWCEPCLDELPNLRRQYEAYKDRGLEIIAVSIDQDRPALEEFVRDEKIPWPVIHDRERLGAHPSTIDYGIFKIPNMMLIDKEGKVVSTKAKGAELNRLLKELLGP